MLSKNAVCFLVVAAFQYAPVIVNDSPTNSEFVNFPWLTNVPLFGSLNELELSFLTYSDHSLFTGLYSTRILVYSLPKSLNPEVLELNLV